MMMRRICVIGLVVIGVMGPMEAARGQENLRRTAVVEALEANRAAVVNVNTTHVIRRRFGAFSRDPLFREFLRRHGFEQNVERKSLGSGFILHPAGYIATNAHVVQNADEVEVNLAGDQTLEAKILASDTDHDLAILKVDPPEGVTLEAVELGTSADLMQGEPALAIGNPLGYHHSATNGIISALGRELPVREDQELTGLIQTDTPINPGNSGGPLLNVYGKVVGVTTAIRGDAQNIGFAIPVDQLRDLIPELLSPLAINRVQLGGRIVEEREVVGPNEVRTMLRWEPAGEGGQAVEVTEVNGTPVENIVEAYVELLRIDAGQSVAIGNGERTVSVTGSEPEVTDVQRMARLMLGLTPRDVTAADRAQLQLGTADGVLVESVQQGGPAARAGIEPGDVIVQLGHHRVEQVADLAALLSRVSGGEVADVFVLRGGRLGRTRMQLRNPQSGRL